MSNESLIRVTYWRPTHEIQIVVSDKLDTSALQSKNAVSTLGVSMGLKNKLRVASSRVK